MTAIALLLAAAFAVLWLRAMSHIAALKRHVEAMCQVRDERALVADEMRRTLDEQAATIEAQSEWNRELSLTIGRLQGEIAALQADNAPHGFPQALPGSLWSN